MILEEFYDLAEQRFIHHDCLQLVKSLDLSDSEQLAISSDVESIITTFSKSNNISYRSKNGWIEIIQPLIALKLTKEEVYCCFEVIVKKYVPKSFNLKSNDCCLDESISDNGSDCSSSIGLQHVHQPFHLLRLLLLYHDPQLCSFLDTKKVSPEMYSSSWVSLLFHSTETITPSYS